MIDYDGVLVPHTQVAREWLREVAVSCRRYRDELLAAVLELLLCAPPSLLPAQVGPAPADALCKRRCRYHASQSVHTVSSKMLRSVGN